jgi:hypothetical protein
MAFQAAPLFNADGVTEPQANAVEFNPATIAVVIIASGVSVLPAPTIGFPQRATAGPIG